MMMNLLHNIRKCKRNYIMVAVLGLMGAKVISLLVSYRELDILTQQFKLSDYSIPTHAVVSSHKKYNFTEIQEKATNRMAGLQPRRGVRYLYEKYNLLLGVEPIVYSTNHRAIIRIVDLHPLNANINCSGIDLTIWVRIAGPEIISGIAIPKQNSSCTWEFSNNEPLALPGTYEVSVKVLALNDGADRIKEECRFQENTLFRSGTILLNYTPPGVFYSTQHNCCEMCTRHENCTHFVAFLNKTDSVKCVLYSSVTSEAYNITIGNNKVLTIAGISKSKQRPTVFLGCGYGQGLEMNFCLDEGRDDMPFIIQPFFEVPNEEYKIGKKEETVSICSSTLQEVTHGRWVLQSHLNCSMELEKPQSKFTPMYVHKHTEPEDCWIHDRLIGNNCLNGCNRNPKSNLWKSNLTKEIFTYVWKPYDCNLLLYTDEMLARCFQLNGYSKPTVMGDSVSEFFRAYLNKRFDSLNTTIYGNKTVILHNFKLMHMIWNKKYTEWDNLLQNGQGFTLKMNSIGIWLNGPFFIERTRNACNSRSNVKICGHGSPCSCEPLWMEGGGLAKYQYGCKF